MDNLDDFLNALGVASTAPPPQESQEPQIPIAPADPEPATLSDEDYNTILSDIGFNDLLEEEEEERELTEEDIARLEEEDNFDIPDPTASDDDWNENIGEGRDLDAEEDADWQEAIDSGRVIPHFNYVGTSEVAQVGDLRIDANTGEEQVMTDVGVVTIGATVQETDMATVESPEPANEPEEIRENLIPLNSPTLLMDDTTSRFSGAEWYHEIQKQRVIIAGCGGIGSNTILQIARMSPDTMVLYDDDVVETVNMSGQLFCASDIGKSKVDAMVDMVTSYTSMRNIYANKMKFDASCEAGDIMICGFDNMSARRTFFDAWYKHLQDVIPEDRKKCLFLDGRLSLDTLQVFCLTGDDVYNIGRYNKDYLFSDSDADETVCSMKQTTYLACMIGSVMTNLFTNFVANSLDPIIPYDLPFFTEYDAQNMIFKTEK